MKQEEEKKQESLIVLSLKDLAKKQSMTAYGSGSGEPAQKKKSIDNRRPTLFIKAAPIIDHEVKKSSLARKRQTIELNRPERSQERDLSPRQHLKKYVRNPNKFRVHRPSITSINDISRRTISPIPN